MGSLNVKIRTVAGRGRELADIMERFESVADSGGGARGARAPPF